MGFIIGALAAIGLAAAVAVHIQTFFPQATVTGDHPLFFLLHIGAIAVNFPLVLALRARFGAVPRGWHAYLAIFPRWAQALIIVAFAYALVNFALSFLIDGGTAQIRNGHYVLMDHGKFIRDLTQQEYDTIRAHVTRGFSGHWIIFYLLPTLYFLFGASTDAGADAGRRTPLDANS